VKYFWRHKSIGFVILPLSRLAFLAQTNMAEHICGMCYAYEAMSIQASIESKVIILEVYGNSSLLIH